MKNKKTYKNAFSDICVSEDMERKIFSMTVNQERKKRKRFKFAYLVSALLITCILSASVVYAKEIKKLINSWTSSITFKDGTKMKISDYITYVEIKDDAIKTQEYDAMIPMNYEKAEEVLGVNILKSSFATSDHIGYYTGLNEDNTIGRIDLWIADYVHYDENKYISMSIAFLNKNADKEYIMAFEEGLDATANKNYDNKYHIDNLNVESIIYTNDWSNERITATFLYNNMSYNIIGNNISKDEIINFLNSLE